MADCGHSACSDRRVCRAAHRSEYGRRPERLAAQRERHRVRYADPSYAFRHNTRIALARVRNRIASKTAQLAEMEQQLGLTRTEVPSNG